jgi:hypothetical protein
MPFEGSVSSGELRTVMAAQGVGRSRVMEQIHQYSRIYGEELISKPPEEAMARKKHPFGDKYPADVYNVLEHQKPKIQNLYCCGIKEFHGVQNQWVFENKITGKYHYEDLPFEELVNSFFEEVLRWDAHRPVWIFSDNNKKTSPGEALAQYIEANKLGTVVRSGYAHNHNSGCDIQCYVATISVKARGHKFVQA